MVDIIDFLDRQPKRNIFVMSLIVVLILGCVECITGEYYSFLLFYLIPIALVGWNVGFLQGILIVILSVFIRFFTQFVFVPELGMLYWNTIEGMVILLMAAILIHVLRRSFGI